LNAKGYCHEVTILKGKKEMASELLPRVHRIVGLLKRWLMGTHQGAVSHKQAVTVAPAPYDEIVQQTRNAKPQAVGST